MKTPCASGLVLILVGLFSFNASAQVATGTPRFNSFGGRPFDVVNLGNLNVHFTIPILHKAGRGMPFTYDLSYDSSIWSPVTSGSSTTWHPAMAFGWAGLGIYQAGYITHETHVATGIPCNPPTLMWTTTITFYTNWAYVEPSGTVHPLGSTGTAQTSPSCSFRDVASNTGAATDGSGYTLSISSYTNATIGTPAGKVLNLPVNLPGGGASTVTDSNGNKITANTSGTFLDTLGQTVLTVAGGAPSNLTFTYTAPGGSAVATVSYVSKNVATNFGCTGISEYSSTGGVPFVDRVTLADSTYYQFSYEATQGVSGSITGRLASVTLPNGGSITYSYPLAGAGTKNGINCADGSAPAGSASLTRTISPGGTWTYARTQVSGAHWQTKITTPPDSTNVGSASNDTVIDFQADSSASSFANFYETQRKAYQGSSTGGTLLLTTLTCYNTNTTNCPTTAVSSPISQTDVTLQYPSSGQQTKTETKFNTVGLVSDVYRYAFGPTSPGAVLQHTAISYASLTNILDHPASVTTTDNSGNILSKTTYSYDEPAYPVQTPGGTTPQHTNPTSGSRGNLTTANSYVTSSTMLTRHFQYYDTGTPYKTWDVNGTTTSYTYDTTAQGSSTKSCGNSFPTTVTSPATANAPSGLSVINAWDCVGGVSTSSTDANSNSITSHYSDSFYWRPDWVKDQLLNATNFTYTPAGSGIPATIESSLVFNSSSSIAEQLTTFDSLGRLQFSQQQEAVGSLNYDSVRVSYDNLGRANQSTMPYVAGASQSGSSATSTTTYDALGRVTKVVDGSGSGYTSFTFTQNDVLQENGPAPTGENVKQKQLEYDSLGRLTSVCEVTAGTTLWPGGTCSQANNLTGYWTTYSYDFDTTRVRNRVTVTQNAQATSSTQTRIYLFDLLGRLVLETNPETGNLSAGTTAYAFDSDSGGDCSGTYSGDLVKKTDNRGNKTCYTYDSLHRVLTINPTSGSPDFANTPAKAFVYDAATYNTTAMSNAVGRLAEAYTGPSGSKKTDEYFSYSKRGELADFYEHTPNSGSTAYHVTAGFWASGGVSSLSSNLSGLPNQTYGVDGKGRPYSVTASSGTNPNLVTSTLYNLNTYVNTVAFGSGDSDVFTFDSNTGRLKKYQFNVGTANSDMGTLTWNANGSLKTLAINDTVTGASDSQTCNYTHDDLARIASVNCGNTTWRQNFSYDTFGNITKDSTGFTGLTFAPVYSITNQFTSLGSVTPTYDGDGRLTYDGTNHYTWDTESNLHTVDTSPNTTIVYDAFGRMVETQASTTYTQIVYSPVGNKIAVMSGSVLQKGFVPLPTGATAVYTSSGLAYFRHHDHLGSSRLATTPSRTLYSSTAYAPYGEPYKPAGTTDLSFTGQDQDTALGMHDFWDRRFIPTQGRWLSPDAAGLSAVNPASPQSWNRYAYVNNNPLALIDPFGDQCYDVTSGNTVDCGGYPDGTGFSNGKPVVPGESTTVTDVGPACPIGGCADSPPPGTPDTPWSPWTPQFPFENTSGSGVEQQPKPGTPSCMSKALSENGVSILLDAAGVIPGVGNLISGDVAAAKSITNVYKATTALVATGHALLNNDLKGATAGSTSLALAVAEGLLDGAKAVPVMGNIVSFGTLIVDTAAAIKSYRECTAKPN